jgi:iron complex outermembrane receptor protein
MACIKHSKLVTTFVVVLLGLTAAAVAAEPATQPAAASRQSEASTRAAPGTGSAYNSTRNPSDLTSLSLEDLMNVQVTSVTKESQKISDAPASVTVIGPDDIQRSGMSSIPELLRLVPGMDVAQIDANSWAISARGMNGYVADDLLVQMDGRSVYSPVFGGVTWNTVSYPLMDLDRIEVIRGPGSTLYGSNAVNGVVNIISKSSRDTQGWLIDTRGGSQQDVGTIRYGGQIDDKTFYRFYTQYQYTGANDTTTGDPAQDEWQGVQSGFRIDRYASPEDTLTLQGDGYEQNADEITTPLPISAPRAVYSNGGNLLGRWTHTDSDQADSSLQAYYDRQVRVDSPAGYNLDTFDVQYQNRFPIWDWQELTWGTGARDHNMQYIDAPLVTTTPNDQNEYILNGFVQDQVTIVPERLQWYLGSKLEYNNLTNTEIQPSSRLLWTPDQRNTIWAAISQSSRIPSIYQDTNLTFGPLVGGTEYPDAESTLSYELGYKVQPAKTLTMDVTAFYNNYRDLILEIPNLAEPGAFLFGNALRAQTYGTEFSANWQAAPTWRLAASYSLLVARAQLQQTEFADQFTPAYEAQAFSESSPKNQFQIHSYLDLLKNLQLNTSLYYVDTLGTVNEGAEGFQQVPSYFRMDMNMSWQFAQNMSLTVGVQNLLEKRHYEYGSINSTALPSEVPRSIFAELKIAF